jgi:hypothetical protein
VRVRRLIAWRRHSLLPPMCRDVWGRHDRYRATLPGTPATSGASRFSAGYRPARLRAIRRHVELVRRVVHCTLLAIAQPSHCTQPGAGRLARNESRNKLTTRLRGPCAQGDAARHIGPTIAMRGVFVHSCQAAWLTFDVFNAKACVLFYAAVSTTDNPRTAARRTWGIRACTQTQPTPKAVHCRN